MIQVFIILSSFFIFSCSHSSHTALNSDLDSAWKPQSYSDYKELIHNNTKRQHEYFELENIHIIQSTRLTPEIQMEQLKQNAHHQMWTREEAQTQKAQLESELNSKTVFFISVFSDIKKLKHVELKENAWAARLQISGQSYNGTFKRIPQKDPHLKRQYPHANPWSKAYLLSFPISSQNLINEKIKLILSHPQGSSSFQY